MQDDKTPIGSTQLSAAELQRARQRRARTRTERRESTQSTVVPTQQSAANYQGDDARTLVIQRTPKHSERMLIAVVATAIVVTWCAIVALALYLRHASMCP